MSDTRVSAVISGLIAFLGSLANAVEDGLTPAEWLLAASAGAAALGAAWGVPAVRAAALRRRIARSDP